jgi:predicted nucleic acid-binding Zn ribbon protein
MRKANAFLNQAVQQPEVLRASRAQRALVRWSEVVGADMATRCTPDRFDKGTLWVSVISATWAQELRMSKDTILTRLNEVAGEKGLFVDVRFGTRPLTRAVVQMEVSESETLPTEELSIAEIARRRLERWKSNPEA